jgi:hypothetical protein
MPTYESVSYGSGATYGGEDPGSPHLITTCEDNFSKASVSIPDNFYTVVSSPAGDDSIAIGAWQDFGRPLGQGTSVSVAMFFSALWGEFNAG